MSLGLPLFLALLALPAALAVLATRGTALAIAALPGAWARAVGVELRAHIAGALVGRGRGQVALVAAIACVLALALARPLVDRAGAPPVANLAGRALVLDMARGPGTARVRLEASALIEAAPEIPTALIAVAGDAYTLVPLTTDRRQLGRYLQALEPDAMPVPGRALHLGLAHAEAALRSAGTLARQIVLISPGAAPAELVAIAPGDSLRAVLPVAGGAGWDGFAAASGAELARPGEVAELDRALLARAAETRREGAGAALDLGPWLTALAMLLWLGLLRRRAGE